MGSFFGHLGQYHSTFLSIREVVHDLCLYHTVEGEGQGQGEDGEKEEDEEEEREEEEEIAREYGGKEVQRKKEKEKKELKRKYDKM